ncbi:MFS transporter [Isoptericola cucumis]|uniref:MFS transporter n=1 Tax=Isoptericola cucumis TaxID=1776856 RepID=UPI0032080032
MPVLLVVTFLAFCNYAAMLAVVPLWAAHGGAASGAVGATTGVMMAATVATQLAMPWLFRVLSLRAMLLLGAVLLGVPTPFYVLSSSIVPVMGLTVVRGVGFGLMVVAGATLVTAVARPGRLAAAASLYGAAAALPNLGALAGSVWLARTVGFTAVFWAAGVAALAGAALALALPGLRGSSDRVAMVDVRAIAAPLVVFVLSAASFGAVTTFLPVAVPGPGDAALALLVASVALVAGRLGSGAVGDRLGPGRLLPAGVLLCAAGLAVLAGSLDGGVALQAGAALLGLGFGTAQNDSFVTVVRRLGPARSGTASTIWNIAYDGGLGLGAVALGGVVAGLGYAGAFVALAGAIAVGLVVATLLTPRSRATPGR